MGLSPTSAHTFDAAIHGRLLTGGLGGPRVGGIELPLSRSRSHQVAKPSERPKPAKADVTTDESKAPVMTTGAVRLVGVLPLPTR